MTIAKRPSVARDGMDVGLIWVNPERIYFCNHDWTGQIRLIQLNKFDFTRASFQQHHIHEDRAATEIDLVGSYRIRFASNFRLVFSRCDPTATVAGDAFGSNPPYGPMKAMGFANGSTHPSYD